MIIVIHVPEPHTASGEAVRELNARERQGILQERIVVGGEKLYRRANEL